MTVVIAVPASPTYEVQYFIPKGKGAIGETRIFAMGKYHKGMKVSNAIHGGNTSSPNAFSYLCNFKILTYKVAELLPRFKFLSIAGNSVKCYLSQRKKCYFYLEHIVLINYSNL